MRIKKTIANYVVICTLVNGVSIMSYANASEDVVSQAAAADEQAHLQSQLDMEAKKRVKAFATLLKQALVGAIEQGGLENAVEVCHSQAPIIANELSQDGWTIARTSLKTRNQHNTPNAWQEQQMLSFAKQHESGRPVNLLAVSRIEQNEYSFMKAIPTGQVCLACHGSSAAPDLVGKINTLYPHDAAVGFSVEDLRGAFVLTKSLADK